MFAMEVIESVIFDWGGVLIGDPTPGIMKYCSDTLGVSREDYIRAHSKFILDFEKGLISEEKFWERICRELGVSKPKVSLLWADAFKAAYVPREELFSLAAGLVKKGYKTAFLSNTEKPAMQYFHQLSYNMFDVLVFSCAEGMRKPDRKIYELTVQRLGSEAGQSVLIDDKPEYINGAQQAGLYTILFESVSQVKNELIMLDVE